VDHHTRLDLIVTPDRVLGKIRAFPRIYDAARSPPGQKQIVKTIAPVTIHQSAKRIRRISPGRMNTPTVGRGPCGLMPQALSMAVIHSMDRS